MMKGSQQPGNPHVGARQDEYGGIQNMTGSSKNETNDGGDVPPCDAPRRRGQDETVQYKICNTKYDSSTKNMTPTMVVTHLVVPHVGSGCNEGGRHQEQLPEEARQALVTQALAPPGLVPLPLGLHNLLQGLLQQQRPANVHPKKFNLFQYTAPCKFTTQCNAHAV